MTPADDGDRARGPPGDARRAVAVLVVALALASVTAVPSVAAIDQVAFVSPDRTDLEADPGETVELTVALESRGGHGGEGVTAVALIAQYDPEYLTVTDVERGPWLEGEGTEVEARSTLADEAGTAILEQRREPAAGGTTGSGTIATLTVRVAEDAPAGTTPISFGETDVTLTGDYPPAVADESATVAIAGGNESLGSFDHPDPDGLERDGEFDSSGDADDTDAAASDGGESVPGMTIGAVLAALALGTAALAVARDRRRG
ncbi:cellulosome anchor protein [Natrinema saccharevitans]|uniref:Cellulosome anchor protein n=1 Tax=Natrinema saccharevitans TaxID=301967 RepID=A0A1S8AZ07_9EURY|nr:cohesin domain-containing protein [Natrinema saccharevitans]OLZ41749.1 cellulosome anchor protein [Natrinema saccharevitans]